MSRRRVRFLVTQLLEGKKVFVILFLNLIIVV